MNFIYLDSSATTPLLPTVWEKMSSCSVDALGNPASTHSAGRRARRALEDARELTAHLLGADADEVYFTSGATEANNLALFGLAGNPPGHLLISPTEHPSIIEPARQLERSGFIVEFLPVDQFGRVAPADLAAMLQPQTRIVSVMLANNETGIQQPIAELCHDLPAGVSFHCDAAAAAGKVPIDFHGLAVTSLTICAHKFHGPVGVGALLLQRNARIRPLAFGGHQQRGIRPGTESVPLAVGLAAALQLAVEEMEARHSHIVQLRNRVLKILRDSSSPIVENSPEEFSLPYTVNVAFPGCRADLLLMNLDLAGVACSTGSACSSGSLQPSPVLRAMGVPDDVLHSSMRFSFHHLLQIDDVTEAAQRIAKVVQRLRSGGNGNWHKPEC